MKNLLIAILSIAVVGLGAYVVILQKDAVAPLQPAPELPEIVKLAAPAPAPTPEPIKPPPVETASEFPDLDSFEPMKSDVAVEQLKKANDLIVALHEQNQVLEQETEPSLMKGLKQMVDSPELKGMMRAGMSDEIKRSHAALFRRLGLNDDEKAVMTELLIDQGVDGITTGIQWMTGNIEQSAARTVAAREKMHAAINEKLGPAALAEYQYWEGSKNEREAVQKFARRLGDDSLTEDTSDQLVDMMYEARGTFAELDHLSQPENFNPKEMTPERREDLMRQVEELHGVYVRDAAQLLNEEQLTQYEASLGKRRQELDGFMKFTHGMFNRRNQGQAQP